MKPYLQIFTVRNLLKEQPPSKVFKAVKQAGYTGVQLTGDIKEAEYLGKAALKAGLKVCGTITSLQNLSKDPKSFIALHKELGADHCGISWHPFYFISDTEDFIKAVNKLSVLYHNGGLDFAYHNHWGEFIKLDGITVFDRLCLGLNPETVSFMPDTYWLQYGGADIRYTLQKLKGRVNVLHIKDMKLTQNGATFCEIGNGNLYWDGIFKTAAECGVKEYVVEQDECDNGALESINISSGFLLKY